MSAAATLATAVSELAPSTGTTLVRRASRRLSREVVGAAAVSDRGRRHHRNEDAVALAAVGPFVAVVVGDGVSTTAHPDRASRRATRAALGVLTQGLEATDGTATQVAPLLARAVLAAQQAVLTVPDREPGREADTPSTTIVAAVVGKGSAIVASIGDSRAYWLAPRHGESCLLTTDDSWAEEAITAGWEPAAAYADAQAHMITRWLGADAESSTPAITAIEIHEPGTLVVCTDGLWNYFESADRLAGLVAEGDPGAARSPLATAQHLVEAALAAGGHDNITVAVIEATPVETRPVEKHPAAAGPIATLEGTRP
jgi:serine/threonine protein phosphatase PrpC